jgi:rhamnosyltransferase
MKNNDMNLLGIVITYYPDVEETAHNIRSYIDDVDKLIIWENTPLDDRDKYKIYLPEYENKIIYMGVDENMFIAYPLNRAVEHGQANSFSHLLTMDQDSRFEDGHFKKYKEIVIEHSDKYSIFGGNPNYDNQLITDIPTKVKTLITSSSIFRMDIFEKVGLFREDYAIDCVDYEFCYRAAQKGIYSYMISSILLHQEFGKIKKTKLGYHISNYPPNRLYYITRNNIKLHGEYPDFITLKEITNRILHPFCKIILSEKNKIPKLRAIVKGVIDGLRLK